jgi:hypothetical protein
MFQEDKSMLNEEPKPSQSNIPNIFVTPDVSLAKIKKQIEVSK